MHFVLNVVLICSLWSSIFARPLLATAPLFPRGMGAAQHALIAHHPSLTGYSLSRDDPRLPPAVHSICEGGLSATNISFSIPFGPGGASLTTGSCAPQAHTPAASNNTSRYPSILYIFKPLTFRHSRLKPL
jgi:hypothetical protein